MCLDNPRYKRLPFLNSCGRPKPIFSCCHTEHSYGLLRGEYNHSELLGCRRAISLGKVARAILHKASKANCNGERPGTKGLPDRENPTTTLSCNVSSCQRFPTAMFFTSRAPKSYLSSPLLLDFRISGLFGQPSHRPGAIRPRPPGSLGLVVPLFTGFWPTSRIDFETILHTGRNEYNAIISFYCLMRHYCLISKHETLSSRQSISRNSTDKHAAL